MTVLFREVLDHPFIVGIAGVVADLCEQGIVDRGDLVDEALRVLSLLEALGPICTVLAE